MILALFILTPAFSFTIALALFLWVLGHSREASHTPVYLACILATVMFALSLVLLTEAVKQGILSFM